jgi:hypothetical protein
MKAASTLILLGVVTATWPASADDKWDITKVNLTKLPPAADKQGLTYDNDIRPLFQASCFRCHGEERQKGDLRLDTLDATLKGGKAGKVVLAGDSEKSLLVAAVAQIKNDIAMPPKRGPGGRRPGGPPPDGGQGGPPPDGGPGGPPPGGGPGGPPPDGGPGGPPPGGGPGGPGGRGGFGPPPKALTAEQVGLVRAWIDQGAK